MTQAPTYNDLRMGNTARGLVDNEINQMNRVANESESALAGSKNPMLQAYMQKGLNPQPMQSSPIEDNSKMAVAAALSGQVDPRMVLEDPDVLPQYKEQLVAGLSGQQTEQRGLV